MRFMYLFWGLLLVLINVGLGWVDIIANAVGYALMIYALMQLASLNTHFMRLRLVTFIQAGVYLITIISPIQSMDELNPSTVGVLAIIMSLGMTVIGLLLIYFLTYGIAEYCGQQGKHPMVQRAKKLWFYNWVVTAAILANMLVFLIVPTIGSILAYLLLISNFVVTVMVLKLVYDVGRPRKVATTRTSLNDR